jgi:hypothetical protein
MTNLNIVETKKNWQASAQVGRGLMGVEKISAQRPPLKKYDPNLLCLDFGAIQPPQKTACDLKSVG